MVRSLVNKSAIKSIAPLMAAIMLVSAVVGCSSVANTRGNFPLAEVVSEIKPGRHTRREIVSMLGSPSTKATFDKQEFWYYIGEKTETFAFFKPKLIERKIIVVEFDKNGIVESIKHLDASNGKTIEIVERVTPTKGKELNVLQQLLGNVGRFDKSKSEDE